MSVGLVGRPSITMRCIVSKVFNNLPEGTWKDSNPAARSCIAATPHREPGDTDTRSSQVQQRQQAHAAKLTERMRYMGAAVIEARCAVRHMHTQTACFTS
jgi:hypothetical protein